MITAIGLFIFHNMPLGVFVGITALPLVSWGFAKPLPLTLGFLAMLLIIILRRLTAPRTSVTASVSRGQLLVNRLLLDRDIRNREAWINRVPLEASSTEQPQQEDKRKG